MTAAPRIGAVLPVYNGAGMLPQAIASLRAELGTADEIVVVDDGSTDATADVARRLADAAGTPLRLLQTPNRGPAAARNTGVAALRASYVAFLDVDDEWSPGRTDILLRRMQAPRGCDAVFGKTRTVAVDRDDPLWGRLFDTPEPTAAALVGAGLYRRDAFARIGGFDEALRFGEDMDWFLRALEARLSVVFLDHVVLDYRLHAANMTRDRAAVNRSIATVLSRSVARRRRAGDMRPLPQPSDLLEMVE